MGVEIRRAGADEFEAFGRTISAVFGGELATADLERFRPTVELDRNLVAEEDGRLVGTAEALRFTLTVPGAELAAAGVTSVGVLPTHRRQGILTRLMRRQLDDLRDWGEPLAVLWASEGNIYHRFGYGMATRNGRIEAERDRFAFRYPVEPAGRVRLVSHEEALELLPGVYDRVRSLTPGFFRRSPFWWDTRTLADTAFVRRGAGPLARAVVELDGVPEAYALYRIRHEWEYGVSKGRLEVVEEVSASPSAAREIWRYLFGADLIERVRWRRLAPDHPLFLLAAEPSRLHFSMGDGLWLRLVDARTALAARSYAAEGALVLELSDPFCPWNEGRWLLEASPTGAAVERVSMEPDLRLDASDLGAVYLGGWSFAGLVRAGRIEELRTGAVARGDELFRPEVTPWCPEAF
jgi:predicted acetyltransferase